MTNLIKNAILKSESRWFRQLTSHRLVRPWRVLCMACMSTLSVRRSSSRSAGDVILASRDSSAEKWVSRSLGASWMPQMGHELGGGVPTKVFFGGPIPEITEEKSKNRKLHKNVILLQFMRISRPPPARLRITVIGCQRGCRRLIGPEFKSHFDGEDYFPTL